MLDSGGVSEQMTGWSKGTERTAGVPLWQWAVAAVVAGVCLISGLDAIGLVGPDEPRYAEVAREMAVTGDWVTPRLWGTAWFEKPVLYYWGAAAAMRVFGVDEFAARLPSALAALLALLGLVWAALRQYGARTAWAVALIFPTCVGVIGFARAAGPDMMFAAALTLAMVMGAALVELNGAAEKMAAGSGRYTESEEKREKMGLRIALGVALGAATLAKGPAAIVLAGGSVLLWATTTRRWRAALGLLHPWAIAAWAATSLPWYVMCARRNPEFVRVFLYEHNFERYLTPVFRHEQPVWFFVPVVLIGLLPWTALLAGVARDGWRAWKQKSWAGSPAFFYTCWAVWPVVFFSLSKSKLPGYVLPVVAPVVMVMASVFTRNTKQELCNRSWTLLCVGLTLCITAWVWIVIPVYRASDHSQTIESIILASLAATLGGLLVSGLAVFRRASYATLLAAILLTSMVAFANRRVLQKLDAVFSAREAAKAVGGEPANENLHVYRVHRAWKYGLEFYQRKELREWTGDTWLPAWVYTTGEGIEELGRQGRAVRVVEGKSPEAMLVYVYR